METLNIIPYPNYIKRLGADISSDELDIAGSTITITDEIANPEGYELIIANGRVQITAGGPAGAFMPKKP